MLMNIDFINTVSGGMSVPAIDLKELKHEYRVTVKTPGIEVEDLEVEIEKNSKGKNTIKLYHLIPIFADQNDEQHQWKSIRVINHFVLPDGVDTQEITANYDQQRRALVLHLPFGTDDHNFRKKVDIGKL